MNKLLTCILLLILSACAKDKLVLKPASYAQIDGWEEDSPAEALPAFLKSCDKFSKRSDTAKLHATGVGGTYSDWREVCDKAISLQTTTEQDPTIVKQFFEENFQPYLATNNGNPEGRFTGYFEIDLRGSLTKTEKYKYPIYKLPCKIEKGNPYYCRADIVNGVIAGKGFELAWVDDPVEDFFLHIQGSGRIHLEDGSVLRVGYDGQNGHPYTPIGRVLIERGYIEKEKMSAQAIKKWLRANPEKTNEILNTNPSYVFFRILKEEGPIGAQGVPLTPYRSLAVDKRFVPYGTPIFINAALTGTEIPNQPFKKLLIAQDTGGAIKGPVRGDLFFGNGQEAEHLAGYQNNLGHYFILLPKKVGANG
jgi:membrane-bound lytic murein transglycosylase A